jgi:hypothetical protein
MTKCRKKECSNKCDTELVCKSTAALNEEIKEDLSKADGSLKELIENDTREKNSDG